MRVLVVLRKFTPVLWHSLFNEEPVEVYATGFESIDHAERWAHLYAATYSAMTGTPHSCAAVIEQRTDGTQGSFIMCAVPSFYDDGITGEY
jgi:hypothetical protein